MQKKHSFPGILVRYKLLAEDCFHSTNCNCFNDDKKKNAVDSLADKNDQSANENNDDQLKINKIILDDELHVNLWEMGENNRAPFMDIGVMISQHSEIDEVVIDLPWEVDKKDINDLGTKLNSEKSVAAIFNEVVHYDGLAEGNSANISFRRNGQDQKPFCLFRLNSQSFRIESIPISNGTLTSRVYVKIPKHKKTPEEDERKSGYIRLRIKNIPSTVYTNYFSYSDKALISSNIETRIIDFRINVMRGVPEELMHGNENLAFPKRLKRIHCFLTTIRNEECVSVSKYYNGYRSLVDEDIWNEYIKLDDSLPPKKQNTINNYLGYQWTIKSEKDEVIKDLIVLGRFSKKTSNRLSIIRFIIIVVMLGALGGGVWEILSLTIKNSYFKFFSLSLLTAVIFFILSLPDKRSSD